MRHLNTILLSILLLFSAGSAQGQTAETAVASNVSVEVSKKQAEKNAKQQETVQQLRELQESLKEKLEARRDLNSKIDKAGEETLASLETELVELNSEIELLETTFEQIAIGGVDLAVLGVEEEKFNWRDEIVLIVKPLIENLKGLTEKPRKIESFRRAISEKKVAKKAAEEALRSIAQIKQSAESKAIVQRLDEIEDGWTGRLEEIDREIQLASFQLESLEGKHVRWFQVFKQGAISFAQGRGLTLLLVVFAAIFVWMIMKGVLWLIRKRTAESHERSVKIRYRLAAYGYQLLTALLIAIAIMMVLYLRQDLLLMLIMAVVLIGAALALKNLLPKYITESRLLLNLGSVRENERIIYNGLPWHVRSINMYTELTNPEIQGSVRLPIGQLHEMVSRESEDDAWFPSSDGDWVLDANGDPVKVVRQSVDTVELQDLDSVRRFMPSADYYQAGYPNLSRAEFFRVVVKFGIDYATQTEDMEKIESAFKKGIEKSFEGTPFAEHLLEANVDFHSAGDSSLNYLLMTKFKPDAAQFYNRIKRRIQRSCVIVCTENGWGIPFPQLSVHLPEENQADD